MDALKSLVDLTKTTFYELIAVLMPGLLLLGAALVAHDKDPKAWTIPAAPVTVALVYAVGVAVQGLASFAFRWLRGPDDGRGELATLATALVLRRLDVSASTHLSSDALSAIALGRTAGARQAYDKFVALADMARALALAFPLSAMIVWQSDLSRSVRLGVVAAGVVLALGSIERVRRFRPLAAVALYGNLLATDGYAAPAATGGAAAGQTGVK